MAYRKKKKGGETASGRKSVPSETSGLGNTKMVHESMYLYYEF